MVVAVRCPPRVTPLAHDFGPDVVAHKGRSRLPHCCAPVAKTQQEDIEELIVLTKRPRDRDLQRSLDLWTALAIRVP